MDLTITQNEKHAVPVIEHEHRDDHASRIGMWLFIFTELILFAGLFVVFAVFRYKYSDTFSLAAQELDVNLGTINTIILLLSGTTMGTAFIATRNGDRKISLSMLSATLLLAVAFLIIKYFEWSAKFAHGLFPGSEDLISLSSGDVMFFGLYFFMTGLHALHLIAGMIFITIVLLKVSKGSIHTGKYALLENCSLYWHMVDLIWLFLFPIFYLIN